jgi:hypothetical protein
MITLPMIPARAPRDGTARCGIRAALLILVTLALPVASAAEVAAQQPPVRPDSAAARQFPPGVQIRQGAAAPAAPAPPLVGPAIQRIETASALSAHAFGSITGVRELTDGRILVNDGTRRQLLLMDSALATQRVVLDSLSEIAHSYGVSAGALLPWRGDSTFFVDPAAFAIVVLGPDGEMARVRSVWRVQDVGFVTNTTGAFGFPGVDAHGRVVYRIPATPAPPAVPPPANVPYFPPQPDSAFIVAVNLDTRRADTLGVVRVPKIDQRIRQTGDGRFTVESVTNPLPFTDQWAVLPDGTVAFIRGQDYRIEYLNADGSMTSSQKLPYEWQRLSDDDRVALEDSARNALQRASRNDYTSAMIRWANMYGRPLPAGFEVPEGYVPPPGFARDWILPPDVQFPATYIYACPPGTDPPAMMQGAVFMAGGAEMTGGAIRIQGGPPMSAGGPPAAAGAAGAAPGGVVAGGAAPGAPGAAPCMPAPAAMAGGVVPPPPTARSVAVVPARELPDYRPPLMTGAAGAARADMEGNLWIRTVLPRPVPGGPVYDIVSREGELVNRIQLPPGYTIVGFGRDRVVYLSMRDPTGLRLARVRLH